MTILSHNKSINKNSNWLTMYIKSEKEFTYIIKPKRKIKQELWVRHLIFNSPSSIAIPRCTSSACLEWTRAHDSRIMLSLFCLSSLASATSLSQPCRQTVYFKPQGIKARNKTWGLFCNGIGNKKKKKKNLNNCRGPNKIHEKDLKELIMLSGYVSDWDIVALEQNH